MSCCGSSPGTDADARAVTTMDTPGTTRLIARHGDSLAFIDKPSGILVHNSAWAGPREPHTLVDDVRRLLGDGWAPLHRLDRQTSGVVAFARDADAGAVARWQRALAADDCDKRYWALVRGHFAAAVRVDHAFADDDDDTDAVRDAVSEIAPLLVSPVDRCSLVEIRLLTGRRHQARRHLKHLAHPVIGDASHGKGAINRAYREQYGVRRMALHARSIQIVDATSAACVRAVSKLPLDLSSALCRLFDARDVAALDDRP